MVSNMESHHVWVAGFVHLVEILEWNQMLPEY